MVKLTTGVAIISGVIMISMDRLMVYLKGHQATETIQVQSQPGVVPAASFPFREKPTGERIVFIVGGNEVEVPDIMLSEKPVDLPLSEIIGSPAFNAIGMSWRNGQPFVDIKMRGNGLGEYAIEVLRNEFKIKKSNSLDRNYNEQAFEIVDRGIPILQIYYKGINEVVINGVFEDPFTTVYVTDEGILPPKVVKGKVIKPRPLTPIFKYPSVKYLHEIDPAWEPGKVTGQRNATFKARARRPKNRAKR